MGHAISLKEGGTHLSPYIAVMDLAEPALANVTSHEA